MISGYSFPGNACYTLTCETSSLFLNYKDMFSKESRMSLLGQINQLMFLFTFTLCRMVPFPYLVWRSYVQMRATFHLVSNVRKAFHVICFLQATFIWLLNCYWYRLILKGLIRLLEENGILPKPKDANKYKDVDAHESH